ncbi:glycosyltransferase [Citrobacter portucalensis]|uniref:glycosyltransferase n=1 Tax=Citrobacter portucalensis TaxID=1639133 RepID=UPI001951870D|nr:glycosyltransferase [Citrobacter portucalensis]MBM6612281.1 glycosyltransferase [Citrobacter portucalensis]
MRKNVVAIIVTYNRKALLRKVIAAVSDQSYSVSTVIIVDNNSTDGTYDFIADQLSEHIIYRNTGGNLGGAGGFYFGFKEAEKYNYDYLWLMDDDLMPVPSCLEHLIGSAQQGISQPIRYNIDETCAELSPLTYDLSNPFKINPKGKTIKEYINNLSVLPRTIAIAAIPFEGPLIHRNVVNKVGFPEPRFFIFCDDIEYAIKTTREEIPIVCDTQAKAYRLLVNNQGNDLLSWKGYFMLRNLFYLHKKYGTNMFVRNKSLIIALGYGLSCLLKGQVSQVKIIWHAFWDSSTLKNTELYKPGTKP